MRTRLVALLLAVIWVWNSLFGVGHLGLGPEPALAQAPATSQTLEHAWSLAVARDVRGTLWAAWEVDAGQDAEIYAAQWTGLAWSDAAPVIARPEAWDRTPSLAVAADGTPWLAWSSTLRDNPERTRIYVSRWASGRWSNAEPLPEGTAFDVCTSCGRATKPALAAASDGTMWVAWVGSDGQEDNVFAQRWNGGVWSLPRQVSADDGSPLLYDRQPQLAVGEDGRPWIAWTGNQAGSDGIPIPGDDEIYASRWTGARWAPEEIVSRDDMTLDTAPALALDGQGRPWIAWQARVTEEAVSRLRILASRWDASRQAWTLESMASSPLATEIDEGHPTLAPDSSGAMQVAWVGRARGEPALGYARRSDTGWSAPLLVASAAGNGISAEGEARLVAGESGATLLWLDPLPGTLLPVARFEVPLEEDNSLATWLAAQPADVRAVTVDPYPYRFLAFGDSITWGLYPVDDPVQDPYYPYPSILQDTLWLRAYTQYNVVNSGVSGERTEDGMNRIKIVVNEYRPQYVLIMEGTNDVSKEVPPAEVYDNLVLMIANATQNSGVVGVKVMLATIIPRVDERLEQTRLMNELAIKPVAEDRHVPLTDQWQAFMDYGDWASIMWDEKHPNQVGLQLIADTFYTRVLQVWSTTVVEETVPPTTWIEPLPAASSCRGFVVSWNGTDNLNWVVNYDVQAQVNLGTWTDWLLGTSERSAVYVGGRAGDQIGFRVRGRDLVGNLSNYSAPVYTTIADDVAPEAQMIPLFFAQTVPFVVSWRGSDVCGNIAGYNVQVRVGASPTWLDWLLSTPATSATYNPPAPSYGERVYFRVQAKDEAGNLSAWSPEVSTLIARYTLGGQVLNVRHEPVAGATTSTSPAALAIVPQFPGRFLAFLAEGGSYEVSAQRDLVFGSLPAMVDVAVSANVTGLIFVLPPQDDAVMNGGFEAGGLGGWTLGGTSLPTLSTEAHTGLGAARLDGTGGSASLRQVVNPTAGVVQTLSLMARLEQPGEASRLQIVLSSEGSPVPPVTHTLNLVSDAWTHAWYDLGALQGEPVAVALVVSDAPAIRLDEVSLGTALPGGTSSYLPVCLKQ
jgi:acyl-CoA thioesterase-1